MRPRHGFALLAVLWIVVGAAALSLAAHVGARQALNGARNRAALHRARWRATDCLERAHATISAALSAPNARSDLTMSQLSAGDAPGWRSMDRALGSSLLLPVDGCTVEVEAAGRRLDVNGADKELLDRLWAALGVATPAADSLTDALLDWRDADTLTREHGAEREWYLANGLLPPRDGPLADAREIGRIRGFDALREAEAVLGVEAGRIPLGAATLPVIAALPGFGPEILARIAERRARREALPELIALGATLSPSAREALLERYADLVRLTTLEPDAWIFRTTGYSGAPRVGYTIEVRVVRAGDRAAIVRRRSWIE